MTPANHYLNTEKRKASMMRKPFDWLQEEQWQGIQVSVAFPEMMTSRIWGLSIK